MAKLEIGTVVLTANGQVAIVTGYKARNKKYPIIYKTKVGATSYKGNDHDFLAILGKVDDVSPLTKASEEARKEVVTGTDNDILVPKELKGIKIGDTILIRNRGKEQKATYMGYNRRRPKNCVSIKITGRDYKGPLSLVIGKADSPVGRSEDEILNDIRSVYIFLSPENLSCDGELTMRQIKTKRRKLNKRLKDLFTELGREVSEEEAYKEKEK